MPKAKLYLWSISAAGTVAILLSLAHAAAAPFDPAWLIPVVLAIISGVTVLRMRDVAASFSVGEAFSFAALFLYGPEIGTMLSYSDGSALVWGNLTADSASQLLWQSLPQTAPNSLAIANPELAR